MRMSIDEAINTMEYYDKCHIITQRQAREKAVGVMQKYQKIQKVLERIWNIPSHLINKEECLDRIMETYREVRVDNGNDD